MTIDELQGIGVRVMTDEELDQFLTNQGVGVLGLPAPNSPYLIPMSFGYDGQDAIFFSFVLGDTSRKATLAERADTATFLVFRSDSPFNWQSALLGGRVGRVSPDRRADAVSTLDNAWRPAVLAEADLSGGIDCYEFLIDDRQGVTHTGLPPGMGR